MTRLQNQFEEHASLLINMSYRDAQPRLTGFLNWLETTETIRQIVDGLKRTVDVAPLLEQAGPQSPPKAGSLEQIAAIALQLMNECREGRDLFDIAFAHGIESRYGDTTFQTISLEAVARYIHPCIEYLKLALLREQLGASVPLSAEFAARASTLDQVHFAEAHLRLASFLEWVSSHSIIRTHSELIRKQVDADAILSASSYHAPPSASTAEEIAAIGLRLMEKCQEGTELFQLAHTYGITPPTSSTSLQDYANAVMDSYIVPTIQYLQQRLPNESTGAVITDSGPVIPAEITDSYSRFRYDHPDPSRVAFIMMRFGSTDAHAEIVRAIRTTFGQFGVTVLRADDKQYHDDLFPNVLTYIFGCAFGIAVFERIEQDDFNPNVSLEVGYMLALRKPVCLLKDRTLKTLHTDLVGKLYRVFDPLNPAGSIPPVLESWARDKGLI